MAVRISESTVLSARFALQRTQMLQQDVFKRLATGKKINSGKDNPAGLIASEYLASEIRSLQAESRAIQRADSNARIAEGHATEVSALMLDLKGLLTASANQAGMSDGEMAANQMQIDSTVASIQRIYGNAVSSLDGINMPDGGNASVKALYDSALAGVSTLVSGATNDLSSGNFEAAMTALDSAASGIAMARGRIGGFQKDVLGPQSRSGQIAIENLTESRSRIVDTDYAVEMSNLNRTELLTKSGMKVLQIANQQASNILNLLG